MKIEMKVAGLDDLIGKYGNMAQEIRVRVRAALERAGPQFVEYIRSTKLSGNPLRSITGALRSSINYDVVENGNRVTLKVGSDSPYAAYHEYGYHGVENVRAHTRLGFPVREFTRNVNYAGNPYLRPAIEEYQDLINEEVEAAVVEALSL
jgi:HK97 gp10 family phage protein